MANKKQSETNVEKVKVKKKATSQVKSKSNSSSNGSVKKNSVSKTKATTPRKKTSTVSNSKSNEKKNISSNAIKRTNTNTNVDSAAISNKVSRQETIEKEIIKEIENVNVSRLEEAKFSNKNRNKGLLGIGVIVVILGIAALIISLIANRIVDREFLSDTSITLMMVGSIIIEGFGAFIIINES